MVAIAVAMPPAEAPKKERKKKEDVPRIFVSTAKDSKDKELEFYVQWCPNRSAIASTIEKYGGKTVTRWSEKVITIVETDSTLRPPVPGPLYSVALLDESIKASKMLAMEKFLVAEDFPLLAEGMPRPSGYVDGEPNPYLPHPRSDSPSLAFHDLSATAVAQLIATPDAEKAMELLSFILKISEHRENLRNSILLEFYYCTFVFARDEGFTPIQISAAFTILKRVHEYAVGESKPTLEQSFGLLRDLLVRHSSAQPGCVPVFTLSDAKTIAEYATRTYMQHYNLYQSVFSSSRPLDKTVHYVYVETPALPLPLNTAYTEAQWLAKLKAEEEERQRQEEARILAEQRAAAEAERRRLEEEERKRQAERDASIDALAANLSAAQLTEYAQATIQAQLKDFQAQLDKQLEEREQSLQNKLLGVQDEVAAKEKKKKDKLKATTTTAGAAPAAPKTK